MEKETNNSKPIGIVGLGLIGGSLGLDLQRLGYQVHGLAHRVTTVQRAKERGLAHRISTDPQILNQCSIIIFALPLPQLLKPSPELIKELPLDAVITDVGSVKAPILKTWEKLHPNFVASHPMCGTNKEGVEAGIENLFKGKPWVATPNEKTNLDSLHIIKELAISLGSSWVTTEASIHDQAVALISHLPVLIGAALLKTVSSEKDPTIVELAKMLASSGFTDTTRVGAGNPELGSSMMENNTAAILHCLDLYKGSLTKLEEKIISKDWIELQQELETTKNYRPQFLKE